MVSMSYVLTLPSIPDWRGGGCSWAHSTNSVKDETWQSGPKKHNPTIFKPLEHEAQLSSEFVAISSPLPLDFVQFASARSVLSV